MESVNRTVQENAEIERSALDAAKRHESLVNDPRNVARYLNPPRDTAFPLEYAFHLLGNARGKTVLDYGCGAGENAVLLAARGAAVIGVDISPDLIELARKRAALNGATVELLVGSAYETGLPDASVDIVFAQAILHHLDLGAARSEVRRVLKPGGVLIVQEPVRDSRVIRFLRPLVPYSPHENSPFERPLTRAEIDTFCEGLQCESIRRFRLPFVAVAKVLSARLGLSAFVLDRWMLRSFPFLESYATIEVRKLSKPLDISTGLGAN